MRNGDSEEESVRYHGQKGESLSKKKGGRESVKEKERWIERERDMKMDVK